MVRNFTMNKEDYKEDKLSNPKLQICPSAKGGHGSGWPKPSPSPALKLARKSWARARPSEGPKPALLLRAGLELT